MARILAISSQVAFGHVGLSAVVPTLQAMGHDVIAVPTVLLSSHYGYPQVGGFNLDSSQFGGIIDSLAANGWLEDVDAVLTGYMPALEIVEGMARVLERLGATNPDVLYLCDPVVGDDPDGLYVPEAVAAGLRDMLVPQADIITPNRFELQWLSGLPVADASAADQAAVTIGSELVAATSIPSGAGQIANVLSTEDMAGKVLQPLLSNVPHGTGDLFAALLLGHLIDGQGESEALARASAGVEAVVKVSLGQPELRLIANLRRAIEALPAPLEPLVSRTAN